MTGLLNDELKFYYPYENIWKAKTDPKPAQPINRISK